MSTIQAEGGIAATGAAASSVMKELGQLLARLDRAERALRHAGFTYTEGAAEWKPPLGKPPCVAPVGWQIVPTVFSGRAGLTDSMMRAFYEAFERNAQRGSFERLNSAYNAMLRAAPNPDFDHLVSRLKCAEDTLRASGFGFVEGENRWNPMLNVGCACFAGTDCGLRVPERKVVLEPGRTSAEAHARVRAALRGQRLASTLLGSDVTKRVLGFVVPTGEVPLGHEEERLARLIADVAGVACETTVETTPDLMSFSAALEALKAGDSVARAAWGEGLRLMLGDASVPSLGAGFGAILREPKFFMVNAGGVGSLRSPSTADMLADDWMIVGS